jgi:hypothetical protein
LVIYLSCFPFFSISAIGFFARRLSRFHQLFLFGPANSLRILAVPSSVGAHLFIGFMIGLTKYLMSQAQIKAVRIVGRRSFKEKTGLFGRSPDQIIADCIKGGSKDGTGQLPNQSQTVSKKKSADGTVNNLNKDGKGDIKLSGKKSQVIISPTLKQSENDINIKKSNTCKARQSTRRRERQSCTTGQRRR